MLYFFFYSSFAVANSISNALSETGGGWEASLWCLPGPFGHSVTVG